jgi:hypothetical protein
MLARFLDAIRRFEHRAHHYQILLAIVVAAIIMTYALFSRRPPALEHPRPDEGNSVACGQTGRTANGG